jgi:hypothetical protein
MSGRHLLLMALLFLRCRGADTANYTDSGAFYLFYVPLLAICRIKRV